MFYIMRDHGFYKELWQKVVKEDQLISIDDLEKFDLKLIRKLDPEKLLGKKLWLLFVDKNEGVCGKAIISFTLTSASETDYALVEIQDFSFYLRKGNELHNNTKRLEKLMERFYRGLYKTGVWLSDRLALKDV